jgi:hypothetical protein
VKYRRVVTKKEHQMDGWHTLNFEEMQQQQKMYRPPDHKDSLVRTLIVTTTSTPPLGTDTTATSTILNKFCRCVISAEYEYGICITFIIQLGVVVLKAVRTGQHPH